ncbi:MAG TPA: helix-turn-helix domain-containing protein, partial [Sphingomicrobium sp.]|nr:helix-turn-helix domain-containing protein [Sphingomicrobium sp.]
MAKRDPVPEALDDEQLDPELPSAGERLRVAREKKGLSLEDVAAQTRIPQRHLASIETGNWDNLPAPTYTIGFAKSYASAVGLDRTDIGNQLREEMGGQRFASNPTDVFEPADPRRTMPKGLVIGTIFAVVVLVFLFSWLNKRSLEQTDQQQQAQSSAPAPAVPKKI